MTETEPVYIEDEHPFSGLIEEEPCGALSNKYNKKERVLMDELILTPEMEEELSNGLEEDEE